MLLCDLLYCNFTIMDRKELMNRNHIMKPIKKIIWKLSLVLFIVLSSFVLFQGIFFWHGLDEYYTATPVFKRGILMIAGLFCLGLFWLFIIRLTRRLSDRTVRIVSCIGFALLVVFQLIFLVHEPCQLRYDALKVFDEALSMLKDGTISNQVFDGYFARYTNNYAITLFSYFILKISSILGILTTDLRNALFILQVVNVLFVDLAFWFGYLLISSFAGRKSALVYLLFILVCPLSYVWLPFFYTNSISMVFMMGSIYLFMEIFLHGNRNPIILLSAGLMLPIGFYIRATQVIICIALLVFFVITVKEKPSKPLLVASLFILGFILAVGGYKLLENKYAAYDKDAAFPTVHWIAMGLNDMSGGTFDTLDETYTLGFATAEEKKDADIKLIKERIETLGCSGIIKLYFDKLKLTFADGTGYYPTELSISNSYDVWYQNVYGNNRFVLQYYCQLTYLFALVISVAGAAMLLLKKEHENAPAFCIYLSMLGSFLFQMIWEAGNIYSIGYVCLFYAGLGFGVSFQMNKNTICVKGTDENPIKNKRQEIERLLSLGFTAVCLCAAFASSINYIYTHSEQERRVWLSVNQYLFLSDSYEPCADDMVLTQTFTADMPFDEIYLQAENVKGDANDSVYRIRLLDENNNLISTTDLNGSRVISYGLTKLDMHSDADRGRYRLSIQKISGNDTLSFLYYDTGNYDAYSDGELTGLKNAMKPDLCFIVLKVLS